MIPRRKPGTYTSTVPTVKVSTSGGHGGSNGHSRPPSASGGQNGGSTQPKSPTSPTNKGTNGGDPVKGKTGESGRERQPVKKSDSFINSRNVFQSMSNTKQQKPVQKSESFSETRRKSSSSSTSSTSARVDPVPPRKPSSTKQDLHPAPSSVRGELHVPKRQTSKSGSTSDTRSSSHSDSSSIGKQSAVPSNSVSGPTHHPSVTDTLPTEQNSMKPHPPPSALSVGPPPQESHTVTSPVNGTVSPPTAPPSKVQGGSPYKVSQGQVQGWSGSHQGFYWSQRVGRAWPLSQGPELDVVGFTLGCHELDPIFLVFLQLWSVCWDMLSKSLHLIILWCDILEVEFIKVILLKWLGFYPSQSLLQITVSIFEGVQGRHCLRSGHPALWSDTSVWRGACWYTIHHCLSGIIRLSFKIRSCNETCRSFLFWNFRHKMTGKILHGECGPIVMASIDDLTG